MIKPPTAMRDVSVPEEVQIDLWRGNGVIGHGQDVAATIH